MSPCSMTGTMSFSSRPFGMVEKFISRRIRRRQKQVRPAVSSVGATEGDDFHRGNGASRSSGEARGGWAELRGKEGGVDIDSGSIFLW